MAMLPFKLPLIVIGVPYSKKQIGFGEPKYGVPDDPYLQVMKLSHDLVLEFWEL